MDTVENVRVIFDAETTELAGAVNVYEQIEQADASLAESAKKTAAAMADQSKTTTKSLSDSKKSIDDLNKGFQNLDKSIAAGAYRKTIDAIKTQLQVTDEQAKKFFKTMAAQGKISGLEEVKQDVQELGTGVTVATEQLGQLGKQEDVVSEKTLSLKAQLRAMKAELAAIDDPSNPRFIQLATQAAALEDRIGDVNQQVKLLSSDTSGIDAGIQAVQGLAGAYAIAQGAAALLGGENEELQKALLQVNAAMSILQGIQQVGQLLDKNSALNIFLIKNLRTQQAVATGAVTVAEEGNTVATVANTTATEGATVATEALNTAMSLNPAAVLILSITALAGAMVALSGSTEDAADAQQKLNDNLEFNKKLSDDTINYLKQSGAERIAQLKADGASEQAIRQEEERQQQLFIDGFIKDNKKAIDAGEEAAGKLQEILNNGGSIITYVNGFAQAKKADVDFLQQLQKTADQGIEIQRQADSMQNGLNIKKLENQTSSNKDLDDAQKKAAEITKRNAQALFEILQRQILQEADLYKSLSENESFDGTLRLATLNNYIEKQTQLLNAQRAHELSNDELTGAEKANINDKYNKLIEALLVDSYTRRAVINQQSREKDAAETQAFYNDMLAKDKQYKEERAKIKVAEDGISLGEIDSELKRQQGILSVQQQSLTQQLQAVGSFGSARKALDDLLYQNEVANINASKDALIEKFSKGLVGFKDFYDQVIQLDNQTTEAQIANAEKAAGRKVAAFNTYFSYFTQFTDSMFDKEKAHIDASDAANNDLYSKKVITQSAYNKQQEKLKKQEAAIEREKAIFDIIVDGAKQVFAINAQAAVLASNPLTLPLAAIAKAQIPQVLIQEGIALAFIAASGFKKGGFTGDIGKDDIAGYVHGQEFVAHAEATQRYKPALEAMNALKFEDYLANLQVPAFQTYSLSAVPDEWQSSSTQGPLIDYDALGQAIAKYVGRVEDIPQTGFNWDEGGVKQWIKEGNDITTFRNNRYSTN